MNNHIINENDIKNAMIVKKFAKNLVEKIDKKNNKLVLRNGIVLIKEDFLEGEKFGIMELDNTIRLPKAIFEFFAQTYLPENEEFIRGLVKLIPVLIKTKKVSTEKMLKSLNYKNNKKLKDEINRKYKKYIDYQFNNEYSLILNDEQSK